MCHVGMVTSLAAQISQIQPDNYSYIGLRIRYVAIQVQFTPGVYNYIAILIISYSYRSVKIVNVVSHTDLVIYNYS